MVKRGEQRFDHATYRLRITEPLPFSFLHFSFFLASLVFGPNLLDSAGHINFLTGAAPLVVFYGVAFVHSETTVTSSLSDFNFQTFGVITHLLMTYCHFLIVLGL